MNRTIRREGAVQGWGHALLLSAAMLVWYQAAGAQSPRTEFPGQNQTNPGSKTDPFGDDRAALDQRLEYSRERTRELARQKRIVDDANRLLALAVQYRTQVQQHGSPTPEDEKLLADIEKLARSVKDRMRGM